MMHEEKLDGLGGANPSSFVEVSPNATRIEVDMRSSLEQ